MAHPAERRFRCAIYTRKSTEEGLDQVFNSLDAQREACAAYVMSQVHEGWELLPTYYDDGGYSGGTLERPGLIQLLEDVKAGQVDIIIVYKVDRLTRSLADFARIVDILDKQGASFVSVTQAFNTTNSMGRLTLNVLLSFAQFEREVTAERIRDKIAASKAKGMWMGGMVPLGYRVENRALVIEPEEADRVRHLFIRYLALGSVYALQAELDIANIRTKSRTGKDGTQKGNAPFSRGCLYQMLRNPIYIGQITHKGKSFVGNHQPIIDRPLFEAVGHLLDKNRVDNHNAIHAAHPSLLTGLVWDGEGRRMTTDHANKRGVRYRYYVSLKDKARLKLPIWRVPAGDLEALVSLHASRHLGTQTPKQHLACEEIKESVDAETPEHNLTREQIKEAISRVVVGSEVIEITLTDDVGSNEPLVIPAKLVRLSGEKRLAVLSSADRPARRDPALIKLILKAWQARRHFECSCEVSLKARAAQFGASFPYYALLLRLGFLAPDIIAAILEGRQPAALNRERLARMTNLPHDWVAQRALLGFN